MGRFGLSPTKPHNSPLITTFYHLASGFRKPGRYVSGYINRGILIFRDTTLGGKLAHLEGQAFRACFRDLGWESMSTISLSLNPSEGLVSGCSKVQLWAGESMSTISLNLTSPKVLL